ncbi:hypothetical protein ACIRVK_03090 [Streptomyces sp. NPDC101152]|uniref:hypothetical protein n=1 Tax=Streptomyces sp. NPDC101152 TaxID=3366116 RepID=UPI0038146201
MFALAKARASPIAFVLLKELQTYGEPTVKRRAAPSAAVLTATATLLLTACGGGKDSSGSDGRIVGADTTRPTAASPSVSASGKAGRPKIVLPSDLTLVFVDTRTGNSTKDAVLADNAERMRAVDAAITGTDPQGRGIAFYNTGKALEAAQSWVAGFEQAGATLTGVARYYDRTVTLTSKTAATLSFCADESKGFSKDKKTNKIARTPVTKNSYVLYETSLDKNSDGVWQTSQIISARGATKCRT